MKVNYFWAGPGWYATEGGKDAVSFSRICGLGDDAENAFADSVEEGIRFEDALRRAGWYCASPEREIPMPSGDVAVWIAQPDTFNCEAGPYHWVLCTPADVTDEILEAYINNPTRYVELLSVRDRGIP